MKKLFFIVLVILPTTFFAQKKTLVRSDIKVKPLHPEFNSLDTIIHNVSGHGVKIKKYKTNFHSNSQVIGSYIDDTRYLGISKGLILSTGTVTRVTGRNFSSNFTSTEAKTKNFNNKSTLEYQTINSSGNDVISMSNTESVENIGTNPGSNFKEIKVKDDSITVDNSIFQTTGRDKDLENMLDGLQTFDARVIEMQILATADTISFRYIFASEEYDEYVCSKFNDVFAFFIDGPGIETPINMARVPGTNEPVAINSVNGGNPKRTDCIAKNEHLYQRYDSTQNMIYDGFTKVMEVTQKVIPGKVYHIKIAIADASDAILDSSVLLENRSLVAYFARYKIYFPYKSTNFNKTEIDKIYSSFKAKKVSYIELIGHCDAIGSQKYNYELSKQRVKAVKEALIKRGVNPKKIIEVYKGEDMPLFENQTASGRKKNRRVDVRLLGK